MQIQNDLMACRLSYGWQHHEEKSILSMPKLLPS